MLELKITGNSASELLTNALQVTALLLHGGKPTSAPMLNDSRPPTEQPNATTVAALKEAEAAPKSGRKPKKAETKPDPKQVDLEDAIASTKPAEMPEGGDEVPEMTEKPVEPAKTYTFQDCKDALTKLYDNHIARAKAAGETDETKLMAGKVAYAKQLVYGFGIQKLMDLKPEQYGEFINKAQPYIDGTAKLEVA